MNLENVYPFIDSSAIYVDGYCIYDKQEKVYSTISQHSDPDFIQKATDAENNGKLLFRSAPNQNSSEALLAYVYQYSLPSASFDTVTLVINIRPDWIIENSNLGEDDIFFALDANKQLILSSSNDPVIDSIIDFIYPLEKIEMAEETPASYTSENMLVTTCVSDSQRWVLAVGTPVDKIFSAVKITGMGLFLIIICILGISVLAAYYSSKKIYNPIHDALNELNSLERSQFKNRLMRKRQSYQRAMNYSHDFQYLLEEWRKEAPKDSHAFSSTIGAILIQIINYSEIKEKLSENAFQACLYSIANVIHEMFEKNYPNECVQIENDQYILIYDCGHASSEDIKGIEELAMGIRAELERILSVTTIWANSFSFDVSSDVSQKHHELNSVFSYKFFTPDLYFYDLDNYSFYFNNISYTPAVETEQQLYDLLSCGNFKESLPLVESALRSTYGYAFNVTEINIQRISYSILASIKKFLLSNGFSEIPQVENIMLSIRQAPSLNSVIQIFSNLFTKFESEIHTRKENKQQILLEKVIQYISDHFADQNLSVELIAETFSMSSLYLGRIFKNYTQKNMSDYINELRVEYAKKQLVLTDKKITDIWPECGFSTKSNFYLVFKNRTSLTPSEYRQNHKIK